ncbi:polysaccharide deacetylase family protein [Paracoccus sediminicola]|uniref:polysaccharide deacetylase family protein n=1 Tax=Paracoccus sediminicola TaxID=3017783 RepID=UPI0022F11E8B|nr:polysaccharide deacetylase family protein [Paracoccus sediminicola]WBU56307.1 polysaccharide deacetylase family protein [Paracoccus sediminicola]
MTVSDDYLRYPARRYGYDHCRYDWTMLADRTPIEWPGGKKLAIWVNVSLQFYPLNQRGIPFQVPNGMKMPYPDLRHFTLRDYGNRVGIYRLLDLFERRGLQPTFAMNTRLAQQTPYLVDRLRGIGTEILCHGWSMDDLHYGGQDRAEEAELVRRSLDTLRELTGMPIRGWLSPARNQSENTLDLLAENGVEYCADWVNDDMPYKMRTESGPIFTIPLSSEIEDQFVMGQNLHSEDSWVEQVCDSVDFLAREAEEKGGRMLGLSLHPWMVGQPHRISSLEAVLDHLFAQDTVWQATSGEILDAFQKQAAGER